MQSKASAHSAAHKGGGLILLVFALAVLVRVYNLNIPFLEPFNNMSRQSMCASVARNFYEHGMNLFYPELDENGTGPSLYNVELPLNAYLMAAAYKALGGVHEWAARGVTVAFSVVFLLAIYFLVRRAEDEETALGALGLAAFSPMVVALSRSVQPDMPMLALGTAALFLFYAYSKSDNRLLLAASAAALFGAILLRIFALYFFIPLLYLAYEKDGARLFRMPRYYLAGLSASLALIWYAYMYKMGQSLDLVYQVYGHALATSGVGALTPKNFILPAKAVLLHLLTPLGAVVCFVGLFQEGKARRFFLVWLLATAAYLFVMFRAASMHPYYFLPLAPPLAYFFGRGLQFVRRKASGKAITPYVAGFLALMLCLNLYYYYQKLYFVPEDRMAVVEAGRAVDALAPSGALVIATYGASPIQLYYCYRHGWAFDLSQGTDEQRIEKVEKMRQEGAVFFVTTELGIIERQPRFSSYLARFSLEKSTNNYKVWRLKEAS
jgi:4-amino-4-deoxy-L-arabinose transferase-like glycosyltransferase